MKIGVHFYFEANIARRVFNFQGRAIVYDKPHKEEFVINSFIIKEYRVIICLYLPQNKNGHFENIIKRSPIVVLYVIRLLNLLYASDFGIIEWSITPSILRVMERFKHQNTLLMHMEEICSVWFGPNRSRKKFLNTN